MRKLLSKFLQWLKRLWSKDPEVQALKEEAKELVDDIVEEVLDEVKDELKLKDKNNG